MKDFNINIDKITFLKKLISSAGTPKCDFCKYKWRNYIYTNTETSKRMLDYFSTKCSICINSIAYKKLDNLEKEQKYWFVDNFKPLYDWDEGDKNG